MKPNISIIMPVFLNYRLLPDAVRSVLNQTVPEDFSYELVIVEDGTVDGGYVWSRIQDLMREIRAQRSCLTVTPIRRLRNDGASIARAHGVAAASANWLTYLDVDDTMHRDHIAHCWQNITEFSTNTDLFLFNYRIMHRLYEELKGIASPKVVVEQYDGDALKAANNERLVDSIGILHSKAIYDRVGGWPPFLVTEEDCVLVRRMIKAGAKVQFDERLAGDKRVFPQGQGKTARRPNSGLYIVLDKENEQGPLGQYLDDVTNFNDYFVEAVSDPMFPVRNDMRFTYSMFKPGVKR